MVAVVSRSATRQGRELGAWRHGRGINQAVPEYCLAEQAGSYERPLAGQKGREYQSVGREISLVAFGTCTSFDISSLTRPTVSSTPNRAYNLSSAGILA